MLGQRRGLPGTEKPPVPGFNEPNKLSPGAQPSNGSWEPLPGGMCGSHSSEDSHLSRLTKLGANLARLPAEQGRPSQPSPTQARGEVKARMLEKAGTVVRVTLAQVNTARRRHLVQNLPEAGSPASFWRIPPSSLSNFWVRNGARGGGRGGHGEASYFPGNRGALFIG